ncbi:MAG: NUDIX hydrolase, partial [Pseudolabrys sp.]
MSDPERFAEGFFGYERYRLTVEGAQQTREVVRAGRVAAVLPIDVARDEIVLIRQFRLPAHLANGHGELVEIVAGRVEQGEQPAETARRECAEEIGVAPAALVELFSYLTTPGLTDEQVTVFLAAVDASSVPERTHATEGERISVMRAPIDTALAALTAGT